MTLAVVRSRGLAGMVAPEVTVEVHLANGLPSFTLVGLPDTEVKEARERVRAALQNCRFEFPCGGSPSNLAPAELPKESGRFDLPIALGILAASGQIDARALGRYEFAGELSLSGRTAPGARRAGDGLRGVENARHRRPARLRAAHAQRRRGGAGGRGADLRRARPAAGRRAPGRRGRRRSARSAWRSTGLRSAAPCRTTPTSPT